MTGPTATATRGAGVTITGVDEAVKGGCAAVWGGGGGGSSEDRLIQDRRRDDGRSQGDGRRRDGSRGDTDFLSGWIWRTACKNVMLGRNKPDFTDIDPFDTFYISYKQLSRRGILLGDGLSQYKDSTMLTWR